MTGSRRLLLILAVAGPVCGAAGAQTTFWTESFENGCNQGCLASSYVGPNGAWSIQDVGAPLAGANTWYVSCTEALDPPSDPCGQSCLSTGIGDESLHVANPPSSICAFLWCPSGDCGAAYDACGPASDKRAVSPIIDCTGKTGISVTFEYIGLADPCVDRTDLEYSSDGGTSWITVTPCLTAPTCGSGQGQITTHTVDLPASASGNPNVRIAFHWQNDDDFIGFDPSFAVDDIALRSTCEAPLPTPMDLGNDLRATESGADVHLDWSLMGPPGPATTHYHVYRSTSPAGFPASWTLIAAHSPNLTIQFYDDPVLADGSSYYYDVRSATSCEVLGPNALSVNASSSSPSCGGSGVVQFSAQASGGQQPYFYDWDFGDGTPHATTASTSHTYAYPPFAYTATITVTDSNAPPPQVVVVNLPVSVGPGTLAVAPTRDGGGTVPSGVPIGFYANPSGGVPPYAFRWSFGDGTPDDTNEDPAHVFASPGTYTVTLVISDDTGCAASAQLIVEVTLG